MRVLGSSISSLLVDKNIMKTGLYTQSLFDSSTLPPDCGRNALTDCATPAALRKISSSICNDSVSNVYIQVKHSRERRLTLFNQPLSKRLTSWWYKWQSHWKNADVKDLENLMPIAFLLSLSSEMM